MAMLDTLKKLCATYGATGREDNIASVIKEMVAPYVDEIKTDALGNLICLRKGGGKRVMAAAHMDQIGFVACDFDDNGFVRVQNVGGINKNVSLNRHVIFENGVGGTLSYELREHDLSDRSLAKMFIDIGAATREEAAAMVKLGDVAVYAPDVYEVGKDCLSGPAMDNRAGCAVLIEALKALGDDRSNTVCAVFTVQEEVGLRGARVAAYGLEPDYGLALDVTLTGDTPKGHQFAMKIRGGIAVKVLDSSLICAPVVVRKLEELAELNNISYQLEVLSGGGTDAGAIQMARGGVPSGVLSVPCRYVHSAAELVCIPDMEAGAALLAKYFAAALA